MAFLLFYCCKIVVRFIFCIVCLIQFYGKNRQIIYKIHKKIIILGRFICQYILKYKSDVLFCKNKLLVKLYNLPDNNIYMRLMLY